jgi:hypothetical protein
MPGALQWCSAACERPGVIWLLLVVLTIVGGIAAVGVAARERSKLPAGPAVKQLGAGGEIAAIGERTLRELRDGDVLTIDERDFVCEGTISYDEDGHRWLGGRVVDGQDVRWLVIGIERAGVGATRLLVVDESQPITGYPPEALVIGEVRYVLDKRGTATCELRGDVGAIGSDGKQERKQGFAERCRWWLYSAPGDDTLIVEQWGADYRVLRGKKVADGTIDMMPGS